MAKEAEGSPFKKQKIQGLDVSKYSQSAARLKDKAEKNRGKEIKCKIDDTPLVLKLTEQIRFFQKDKKEISEKVKNTNWYKRYYEDSHEILDTLRAKWQNIYKTLKNPFLQEKLQAIQQEIENLKSKENPELFSQEIEFLLKKSTQEQVCDNHYYIEIPRNCNKEIVSTIIEKLREIHDKQLTHEKNVYDQFIDDEIRHTINNLESELSKLILQFKPEYAYRSIVWGMPENDDDFIYLGKTSEKTVSIPYKAIHQKLAEANWLMRGYTDTSHNYLLVHMLFIVSSSEPHVGQKYVEGRAFIDFPIVLPHQILQQHKEFVGKKTSSIEDCKLGRYPEYLRGEHSESALVSFFKYEANISWIVGHLKSLWKLKFQYAQDDEQDVKFKVYATNMFINSQKNVCSWCERELYDLMTSQEPGSFFSQLKAKMTASNLVVSDNPKKPYMLITVSAHQFYDEERQHSCNPDSPYSETLIKDAQDALARDIVGAPKASLVSLDVKQIAGKVILSTAEHWLYGEGPEWEKMTKGKIELETKIPFYTGFRSAGGCDNRLEEVLLNDGKKLKKVLLDEGKRLQQVLLDEGKHPQQVLLDAAGYLQKVLSDAGEHLAQAFSKADVYNHLEYDQPFFAHDIGLAGAADELKDAAA